MLTKHFLSLLTFWMFLSIVSGRLKRNLNRCNTARVLRVASALSLRLRTSWNSLSAASFDSKTTKHNIVYEKSFEPDRWLWRTFKNFLERSSNATVRRVFPIFDYFLDNVTQRLIAIEEGRQVVLDELSWPITALSRLVLEVRKACFQVIVARSQVVFKQVPIRFEIFRRSISISWHYKKKYTTERSFDQNQKQNQLPSGNISFKRSIGNFDL